ncbi:hypothetical protein EIN_224670 [Entamoeba invadens IP1]|uniref:Uncharacterized protein n=1 Tax=Entamoeba invadens IP1 TaxID=370355 RepID=A0A0A1U2F1_ENTIV|nr:hypothetical protein EIN_224670 [Entamoeba invadens IP1]ELP88214.1 hypothetical protein EIN_224670 [Entamoeba invadens IP1]|eukprot:XP_004254985.1 hypothetical protein EIN_224670 [Entamoeba invadens IP1]
MENLEDMYSVVISNYIAVLLTAHSDEKNNLKKQLETELTTFIEKYKVQLDGLKPRFDYYAKPKIEGGMVDSQGMVEEFLLLFQDYTPKI